jgi:TetR/AcrR family fatty acid metabolism transcriptional regulator
MTVQSSDSTSAQADDKRERIMKYKRILDAAERIFADKGFFNARMADIARASDVAVGTIYLYFKGKDDLLIALFESHMERVNQSMAAASASASTPLARLEAMVKTHLELVRRYPDLAEILTVELRQSAKFMKQAANPRFGEYLELMVQVVASGQDSGVFSRAIPAPMVARMIFGIIDELALAWLLSQGESFDIERAPGWVCALVMNGLTQRDEVAEKTRATRPKRGRTKE